jgi:hypothetical protein
LDVYERPVVPGGVEWWFSIFCSCRTIVDCVQFVPAALPIGGEMPEDVALR